MKIVLFGDSIFAGYNQIHDTDAVTKRLEVAFPQAELRNLSKSGATTAEGRDYLEQIPRDAELVLLEYGTNDAALGWGLSPDAYQHNLEAMIAFIGPKRVLVLGPNYPDPKNASINASYPPKRLAQFNKIARTAAKGTRGFIDLIATFKAADLTNVYRTDGQHLTEHGNTLLVNSLLAQLRQVLTH